MKKIIALSLLMVGALFFSGCGLKQNNSSNTVASQGINQGPSVESNTVNIQNFSFIPATLTVKKGATVTWTNNDSAPHQIKSTTFNSSQMSNGQNFSFTFNAAGTFDYSCAIHPSMLGKIIVE